MPLLLLLCRFNEEFNLLVKQKHKDADRLADLASRMDELIKELVKIHMMLAPAPAPQPSSATVTDQASANQTPGATGGNILSGGLSSAEAEGSSGAASTGAGGGVSSSAGGPGSEAEMSGSELAAQLGAGRLAAHWSPLEDLEEQLLAVKPGEVKVSKQCRLVAVISSLQLHGAHWGPLEDLEEQLLAVKPEEVQVRLTQCRQVAVIQNCQCMLAHRSPLVDLRGCDSCWQ
jgi:hypothetical protein